MCKLIYQTQVHFLSAQIALQRVFILGMYIFEALLKRECICEIWRFAQDLCEASLNNKASSNGKKGRIFTQHYDSTYSIFIFWGSSRDEPSAQCIGPLELGAPRTRETTSSVMPRKKSVKSWGVWIFCSSSSQPLPAAASPLLCCHSADEHEEMHYALSPSWFIVPVAS